MNMQQISKAKRALIERVTCPGYQATERDTAEAAELVSQYIDELERLEQTATVTERKIVIHFGGGKYSAEEQ